MKFLEKYLYDLLILLLIMWYINCYCCINICFPFKTTSFINRKGTLFVLTAIISITEIRVLTPQDMKEVLLTTREMIN